MSREPVADTADVAEHGTDATTAETSIGLDENVASALAYLFGFLSGIVLFLVESENRNVRFHAAQSMILFVGLVAISIALTLFGVLVDVFLSNLAGFLVGLVITLGSLGVSFVAFVLWLYLLVRAFQGANPRIPGVAGIADGLVK